MYNINMHFEGIYFSENTFYALTQEKNTLTYNHIQSVIFTTNSIYSRITYQFVFVRTFLYERPV